MAFNAFLMLTHPLDGHGVMINLDHVDEILPNERGGSILKYTSGETRLVAETMEQLVLAIKTVVPAK